MIVKIELDTLSSKDAQALKLATNSQDIVGFVRAFEDDLLRYVQDEPESSKIEKIFHDWLECKREFGIHLLEEK